MAGEALGTPEGIDRRHERVGGGRIHNLPTGLIGLLVLFGLGALGLLGSETVAEADAPSGTLQVHMPERIRNGEFYEMTVTFAATEAVGNLVFAVDESVWQDVTVNTFFPAAEAETFAEGAFEFEFGPVDAGTTFVVKIDCQVNPDHAPAANRGSVAVRDDSEPLAEVDATLEVLP